ncbi:class I SAM-dependent methyltransferase [Hoeflea sp. G2-23]|uniref:Class I SAM-dependent methyltransferase n=1 Tax=Hoeflea algicola TaxID=2983763 RepID=A0ABT3Z5F6_9HYPH|nr:class I SAM-dependent methyltransferase [Hoeflea algicola]MCY0146998.1 class I SAM-dependent methyltransferase [Hoeflea algicola]
MNGTSAAKFDPTRANEFALQSRIGLAGYEACHELAACMLSAALGQTSTATVLVAGAGGTGNEIINAGRLEPAWRFVAVDPSPPMLELARSQIEAAGLAGRTKFVSCLLADLEDERQFDAATLIGVLHHLPGDAAKRGMLSDLAIRLKPGAPLILAANHRTYGSDPLTMAAWGNRWRMNGATPEEVRNKLGTILKGADPLPSEEAVFTLMAETGFGSPKRFFSSLFWGAWICFRN